MPNLNKTVEREIENILLSSPTSGAKNWTANKILHRPIIIYGCGNGFHTFSKFILEKYNITPTRILDKKFFTETLINGIPASNPHSFKVSQATSKESLVIVTIGKTNYHEDIFRTLRAIGLRNIILASDIYEYHLCYTPREILEQGSEWVFSQSERIKSAFHLLSDEKSKRIFKAILEMHMKAELPSIPADPIARQYFPEDIKLSSGYMRVINCGAFDGDTVKRLLTFIGRVEAIACFEPDPDSYAKLVRTVSEHADLYAKETIIVPCGVYSENTQLRFSAGNLLNSSFSENGNITIQCVSLDTMIPNFTPTFINMDIEGAEPFALNGAEQMIKRHQPDLAISVYHDISHLWEIILQINSFVPEYRYYIRNYTGTPQETILYATR